MRCAPLRKEKRLRVFGGAFPWDGMGGNIGGVSFLVPCSDDKILYGFVLTMVEK